MTALIDLAGRLVGHARSTPLRRWSLVAGAVLVYGCLSLWPLDFQLPRAVDNGARWTADGGLRFDTAGLARTPGAPAWLDAVRANGRFELELTARPFRPSQSSSRRILTIAQNSRDYSLLLGQRGRHLIMRIWRTCGRFEVLELRCENAHMARHVFAEMAPVEIRVRVEPGSLDLWVGEEHVYHRRLPEAPLTVWDPSHRLAFGSAVTGSLPWLGEVSRAVLRTGEHEIDLLRRTSLEMPPRFQIFDREPLLVPFTDLRAQDAINNLIMYAPLGALLALLGVARGRYALPVALLILGAVSLGMETAQLFAAGRNPSTNDLILNVTGGGAAFALTRFLLAHPRARRLVRAPAPEPTGAVQDPR